MRRERMAEEGHAGAQVDTEMREFAAGEVVMEQSAVAKGLYVLMSGRLEVLFDGVKVGDISQRGSFVGEIASLLGGRRTATVKAVTPVKMLHVKRVTEYLEQNPKAALMIAQGLAGRIAALNRKFSDFEKVARSWIDVARAAVDEQDVEPIKNALEDTQEVFVREFRAR
jgi:CRP-like cAMP-binding protein